MTNSNSDHKNSISTLEFQKQCVEIMIDCDQQEASIEENQARLRHLKEEFPSHYKLSAEIIDFDYTLTINN